MLSISCKCGAADRSEVATISLAYVVIQRVQKFIIYMAFKAGAMTIH